MGILSRFFSRKEQSPFQLRSSFVGNTKTVSNQIVTAESSMQVAAFYACVKVISESIASLPLHTYKRSGELKERDYNHPLYSLLHDKPNSWQTSYDFRNLMMFCLLTNGNFFAKKLYRGNGKIGELIPLNPKITKAKWNKAGTEVVIEHRQAIGKVEEFSLNEILHIKGLTLDGLNGLSPVTAARESIGLSMAGEQHAAALFGNGAKPGGILYFKNSISDEAQKKFLKEWNEKFSGGGHGKVAMLQADEVKYETLGLSNEDAQFIQIRQFQLSEIARIFRVPAHMIGDLSKSSFSNIEQQSLEFVVHTLRPWLVNIEQAIHFSLLSEKEKQTHYVQFSVDALLRGDTQGRYTAYKTAIEGGFLNRDEVRELEDRNPIPNGDGKVFLQPLNMASVGSEEPANKPQNDGNNDKKARNSLVKLLEGQLSRAMKRSSEGLRKAINTGNVDDFASNYKEKHSDFLIKLIRDVGGTYCDLFCNGISDDTLDDLISDFANNVCEEILQELRDEPNPGLVAQKLESETEIKKIAEKFFNKINEGVLC